MKTKINPVNFQGIIEKKNKLRKKQKQKNDVTGVAKIIHPYKKENKQKKSTRKRKQNTYTHLQHYI